MQSSSERRSGSNFRLGYGFSRSRNGTGSMHAVASIPVVTGAWQYESGSALHSNGGIFIFDKTMIEGNDVVDSATRRLDQSRIGAILMGEEETLFGGPQVAAMLIQNTNPLSICPEQDKVRAGFAREDLFTCVHEQFMSEMAAMADISCFRKRPFWSMTTSTRATATSTSCSARS